jgi:hypothetical protein
MCAGTGSGSVYSVRIKIYIACRISAMISPHLLARYASVGRLSSAYFNRHSALFMVVFRALRSPPSRGLWIVPNIGCFPVFRPCSLVPVPTIYRCAAVTLILFSVLKARAGRQSAPISGNRVSLAGVLYDTHLASISSVVAVDNSFRALLEHSIAGESGDIGPASPQLSHSAPVRKPR